MAGFDATLGGSTATSYITIAEADDLLSNTRFTTTWQANTEAQKSEYLVAATFWLDQVDYAGTRCSPSTDDDTLPQALAWPRSGATCDGIEATCSFIPSGIKNATAVLAVHLSASPDAIGGPIGGGGGGGAAGTYVASQELGDLKISYAAYPSGETGSDGCVTCDTPVVIEKFPWLKGLLSCWAVISSGGGRVILRVRS